MVRAGLTSSDKVWLIMTSIYMVIPDESMKPCIGTVKVVSANYVVRMSDVHCHDLLMCNCLLHISFSDAGVFDQIKKLPSQFLTSTRTSCVKRSRFT